MGKLVLLLGILASFAFGEELTVLVTPVKKVYKLAIQEAKSNGGIILTTGGLIWVAADPNHLGTKYFESKAGFARTLHGTTQVFKNKQQTAMMKSAGTAEPESAMPLPPLGNELNYVRVLRDHAGDLWCETDGGGYVFHSLQHNFTVTSDELEYNAEVPTGTVLVPNPNGEGAFYLSENGEMLHYVRQPKEWGKNFTNTSIPLNSVTQGSVKRILLASTGEHHFLGAVTHEGTFGWLHFRGDPDAAKLTIDFMPVPWPQGVSMANKAEIKTSFEAPPVIRGTMIVYGSDHPVIRTIGEDRIVWKEGRQTRLDRRGNTVAEPAKIFKQIEKKDQDDPLAYFLSAVRKVYNDDLARDSHFGESEKFIGRETEIEKILQILTRTAGNRPILVGDMGIGRRSMGPLVAQALTKSKFSPGTRAYKLFHNAVVVETSAKLIIRAGGPATFFAGVRTAEQRLGRPIITFVNQLGAFTEEQFAAYHSQMVENPSLLVVGITNSFHLNLLTKKEPELAKDFEIIRLLGTNVADTRKILNTIVIPELAKLYRSSAGPAEFTPEAVDVAVGRARQLYPQLGFPEGPRRLLEDMAIRASRKAGEGKVLIDQKGARAYVKDALGLSFDPDNEVEFLAAIEKLRAELNEEIVDQPAVVDWLVNSFRDIQSPNAKTRHRTGLFLGSTGSGKTHLLKVAFKKFFRDDRRILEIDCNKYLDKEALTALLGSWPGYLGSERLGVLPAFLNGNGKNFNGIIFNEFEKASKELANAIMEMMDTGKLTDNQGNEFYVGTSIIGLTSNKGDKLFFPRDAKLTRAEQVARRDKATYDEVKNLFLQPEPDKRYETANLLTPANLQRLDAAFFMLPPSEEGMVKILRQISIADLEKELNVKFDVDDAVLNAIALHQYVPENGAREPMRVMENLLRGSLAQVKPGLAGEGEKKVVIRMSGDAVKPAISVSGGSATAVIPMSFVPRSIILLEDPKVREKLATLPLRLGGKVFGQDYAVELVADAIATQRYIDPDNSRPAVAAFLGSTATGKSELAEVTAEVEFGHRARCKSFQMGNIKNMDDVDNFTGVARGRSGSESAGEFEQFLQMYPEGGVLHFEEMGNVGAGSPAVRNAIFRILYSILEGKWTNAFGKTYDTSKFIVLFSSNEGQELMEDAPADDLRMAIYKRSRSQEFMRNLLRKHGWPEALIGRLQGHLILFKPLLAEDRKNIANKFFTGVIEKLQRRYPLNVDMDDKFLAAAGEAFFSHEQGARAIRDFIEEEMKAAFGKLVREVYEKHGEAGTEILRAGKVKFVLNDNYEGLNYYTGDRPADRKVVLHVTLKNATGDTVASHEREVTDMAPERRLPSKRSLLQVAYHEAGHVVGNDPLLTGQEDDYVTIVGKGGYGGYARPINIPGVGSVTRASAIAHLARLFAARITEGFAGYEPDAGWSSDLRMAREAAAKCITRYGLTDAALRLPMKDNGLKGDEKGLEVDLEAPETNAEIDRLIDEGYRAAVIRVKERWPEIRMLTHALFVKQSLDRTEIKAVLENARSKGYTDGLKLSHQKTPNRPCGEILNLMGLKEET